MGRSIKADINKIDTIMDIKTRISRSRFLAVSTTPRTLVEAAANREPKDEEEEDSLSEVEVYKSVAEDGQISNLSSY